MKIVVGFTLADESRAALEWAMAEAKRHGAEIVVVHSIKGGGSPQDEEQEVLTYREEFAAIDRRLTAEGITHTIRGLLRGMTPAEDIVKAAAEEGADLIAIGIRRRSRTGKLLMGSNAQAILLLAEHPVVSVKAGYQPPAA